MLEAEALRVRAPTGRDQQPLGPDARLAGQLDLEAGPDALDLRAQPKLDALVRERGLQELAGRRILAREQPVGRVHHDDASAGPPEELRKLAADRPGADHGDRIGDLPRLSRLPARPVVRVGKPVDRRNLWNRAGRDRELVVLEFMLVYAHPAGLHHTPGSPHQLDVALGQELHQPRVVPAADRLVPVPEHALELHVARDRLRCARHEPRCDDGLERPQQGLGRHARPVRALASEKLALDHGDSHLLVEPPERSSARGARRAASKHGDPRGTRTGAWQRRRGRGR
jgi:hypothetical protein